MIEGAIEKKANELEYVTAYYERGHSEHEICPAPPSLHAMQLLLGSSAADQG